MSSHRLAYRSFLVYSSDAFMFKTVDLARRVALGLAFGILADHQHVYVQ